MAASNSMDYEECQYSTIKYIHNRIGNNIFLVEFHSQNSLSLGLLYIHEDIKTDELNKFRKLNSNEYELKKLYMDLPNMNSERDIIKTGSHFIIVILSEAKELHLYYKKENEHEITFEKKAVLTNIRDPNHYLKKYQIKNGKEAFLVSFKEATRQLTIHKFTIKNNECFYLAYQDLSVNSIRLESDFGCLFTSKRNQLVLFNNYQYPIVYLDFKHGKERVIINYKSNPEIREIISLPNTDDVLVLNESSIDYINSINDRTGIIELVKYDDIIDSNKEWTTFSLVGKFLAVFSTDLCCTLYKISTITTNRSMKYEADNCFYLDPDHDFDITENSKYLIGYQLHSDGNQSKTGEICIFQFLKNHNLLKLGVFLRKFFRWPSTPIYAELYKSKSLLIIDENDFYIFEF